MSVLLIAPKKNKQERKTYKNTLVNLKQKLLARLLKQLSFVPKMQLSRLRFNNYRNSPAVSFDHLPFPLSLLSLRRAKLPLQPLQPPLQPQALDQLGELEVEPRRLARGGQRPRLELLDEEPQNPLRSPTVFNFFSPDFSLPGEVASAGLTSPEFQIFNETSAIGNPTPSGVKETSRQTSAPSSMPTLRLALPSGMPMTFTWSA